jgi:hypothetical protein
MTKYTPEFDAQFKELYAKGYSGVAMAEIMGIQFKGEWSTYTYATAWMIRNVKRLGLPRRGSGYKAVKSPKQLRRYQQKKRRIRQKRIAQIQRLIPQYEKQIQRWRDELVMLTS